ncbi:glutathione S-transferase [Methylophilus rhizosphaerae]|uniref:Glutathione S-transferase n=1 Tax=Methylophilus rhizosphaerae TaxID=492660 RepID=A0A1G9CY50_9PROT|nr:glutathione S-transferase [Methylophilus rhizosphaerae]SDK56591.1 glutathione S-transferase [Methylophilus rhizosphaerae]
MKLYDLELSGNCYKVRLFCALAGIPVTLHPVDFMGGEHKTAPFLAMNPLGELPILQDGDVLLRDSQAILVYLATQYGGEAWCPKDPAHLAEVIAWLSTAANNIQHGPADARLIELFGYPLDKASTVAQSDFILPVFEAQLSRHDWLVLNRPTIADIANFPYIALAHQGGISLAAYPAIRQWMTRIQALPNFIGMPAID